MDENSLYAHILSLTAPWKVLSLTLDQNAGAVTVTVGIVGNVRHSCPECGRPCPVHDHRHRIWRHLDTCQFTTVAEARVPPIMCPEHGCQTLPVPWARPGSRYTLLFEAFVLSWLKLSTVAGAKGGAAFNAWRSTPKSLINLKEIEPQLATEPDSAFFWSGRTEGVGGPDVAEAIAKSRGGVTLESTIKDKNIKMPEWDFDNPQSIKAWEDVSASYAKQVSGEVRAVVGQSLREGNIWENVELPRLMGNDNVTKITTIDPVSQTEKVIFVRDN